MSRQVQISALPSGTIAQLHTLWQAAAVYDPTTEEVLDEKIFQDADFQAAGGLAAFVAGKLAGFCVGVARKQLDKKMGYIKLIAVAPDFQREGIGSSLLRAVEVHLAAEHAPAVRVAESAPNYLCPGIDVRNVACRQFFSRHGYQEIGEAINQTVNLDVQEFETQREEAELLDQGIRVRRATWDDLEAMHALLARHWPTWQAEVDRGMKNEPVTVHVALVRQQVVGFAAYDANNVGTGWFGPMGTDPEMRGKKIGEVLLKRCLADMQTQDHPSATIPWVGPTGFYQRIVDAQESRRFVRLEKPLGGETSGLS